MKNKYVSYWNQTLQQSQKLSFYCTIKDDYSPSPYLVLTRKNPSRKALVRFRISSHQLRIETGRKNPSRWRDMLLLYNEQNWRWKSFLTRIVRLIVRSETWLQVTFDFIPDFKSLSHDILISLMNSSDYLINCQLASFISQCFESRTKLISMNEWKL